MSTFSHSYVSPHKQIMTARLIFEGSFEASFHFQINVIFTLISYMILVQTKTNYLTRITFQNA